MGKLVSEKEARLQKRLVPVNIAVCVICLVAALTLFLCPILTVNIGKLIHDDRLKNKISASLNGAMGDGFSVASSEKINYAPVLSGIIISTLDKIDIKISVSAVDAYSAINDKDGQKRRKLLNDLLYGDSGIITGTVNGVIDGIVALISSDQTRRVIENSLVAAVSAALVAGTELSLSEEKLAQVADTFKKIETLEDGNVAPVIDELAQELLGENAGAIDPETRQKVIDEIQAVYDETASHLDGQPVTYEAILCVAVSSNTDLSKVNIPSAIRNIIDAIGGSNDGGDSHDDSSQERDYRSAKPLNSDGNEIANPEDEIVEPDSEVEEPDNEVENPDNEVAETEYTIVTSYSEMFAVMGLTEENINGLKADLKTALVSVSENYTDDFVQYLDYYGYVFYAMLIFIVAWLLLFTFSLIHIFTQNKRFMMWYVKLICWIPSVIWLMLTLAPKIIAGFAPNLVNGESGWLVELAFDCVSSYTWINGLCYVLLWAVSIFWAFPIKRKIRRERADAKQAERAGVVKDDGSTFI